MDKDTFEPLCERIYDTLGSSHSECVYQKALCIELYNHGAISVESEVRAGVFYGHQKQHAHHRQRAHRPTGAVRERNCAYGAEGAFVGHSGKRGSTPTQKVCRACPN